MNTRSTSTAFGAPLTCDVEDVLGRSFDLIHSCLWRHLMKYCSLVNATAQFEVSEEGVHALRRQLQRMPRLTKIVDTKMRLIMSNSVRFPRCIRLADSVRVVVGGGGVLDSMTVLDVLAGVLHSLPLEWCESCVAKQST